MQFYKTAIGGSTADRNPWNPITAESRDATVGNGKETYFGVFASRFARSPLTNSHRPQSRFPADEISRNSLIYLLTYLPTSAGAIISRWHSPRLAYRIRVCLVQRLILPNSVHGDSKKATTANPNVTLTLFRQIKMFYSVLISALRQKGRSMRWRRHGAAVP